jgi:uroporphyrinogen decarboxylase
MHTIEINITKQELDERRERIEKARRFKTSGKIPVIPWIDNRYLYEKIGVTMKKVFNDPLLMLEAQIYGKKWFYENIQSDHYDLSLQQFSWFENVREASALGCDIEFPSPDQVWISGPWIKSEDDLKRLRDIDIVHNGLHGREIAFRDTMQKHAKEYKIKLIDKYEYYPAKNVPLIADTDGPFTLAGEIRGYQQIMEDVILNPEFINELIGVVADKEIEWIEYCKKENGNDSTIWMGDDMVQYLSPKMYEEFALPYERKIISHFDGYCMFHLCGRSEHLLDYLVKDLEIDEFSGFGFQLDKRKVLDIMGGKVVLNGNINPMNLLNGTEESIKSEVREAMEIFGPTKGFILSDGADIAPETPIENVNMMYMVAQEYDF